MFKYLYFILSLLIYIFFLPILIYKKYKEKYIHSIPSRFFLKNNTNTFEKNNIWFHACSMGETIAIKPLIDVFDDVNISVITNTGYQTAKQYSQNVKYLPYELFLPFWIKKQKALVVMEAELWYFLFLYAKINNTPTYLINARISDKSYKAYKKYSWFYKKIFNNIDKIFAQSELDKERLEQLGATNIQVIGNIKLNNLPKVTKKYKKPNQTIITAASTHKSEEELIIKAWNKNNGKLIIVPRHPDRFEEVYLLIEKLYANTNTSYHKFSIQNNFNSDIILIDLMGELNCIYEISDLVILGGSFIKTAGGHNPIEPAFFKTKLISGKTIFNQKSLFDCVNNYYLINHDEIKTYINDIQNLDNSSIGKKGDIQQIITELKTLNKKGK
jgi:3-deoxy-D-manno-octulosonic-acid transferase